MLIALVVVAGCHSKTGDFADATPVRGKPGDPGDKLLKMSMDHYKSLKSFSADSAWLVKYPGQPDTKENRTVAYEAPNRFKVTMAGPMGLSITSVSDGTNVAESTSMGAVPGSSTTAPKSIADSKSVLLQNPMLVGTLLYKFFGGSVDYNQLVVATKGAPVLGAEVKEPEETAQHVKFYSAGMYGNTDALIGERTGKVYEMSYDFAPLLDQLTAMPGSKSKKDIKI